MLALRWHAAHDIRLDEVDEPREVEPGFAILDVAYCGICGSDLAEYRFGPSLISLAPHPLSGQAPPITLGHELSGRVAAVAPGARFPVGTRVTVDACWRCGRCEACLRGDYHLCRYGGSIGLHSDGAFAARVVVPEYTLIALSDAVSDLAAALTEPLAVGLHALDRAGARAADDVLVLGFGPLGAATALCARAMGARPTVVELDAERLRRAEALGFAAMEPGEDLPRRVRRALGSGGADVVVDSTGAAPALPTAVECARRGGRIAVLGMPNASVPLDPRRLVLFERSLVGSLGYRHDLQRVVTMLAGKSLDATALIDDVVPLSEAARTVAELAAGSDGRIKVLVTPGG